MYTKQALHALGVKDELTTEQKHQLDDLGYIIVEDVITEAQARAMAEEFERLHAAERDTGGKEVHIEPGSRRLSNIFNKSPVFDPLLEIKPVLAAAHYLLGEIKVHGANIRDPVKGYGQQQLHVDVPKHFDDDWWVVNAMILFDDMTLENGPTRVIPQSHKWAPINVPVVNQGDWEPSPLSPEDAARVPEDLEAPYPGELLVTAPARSAVILNSSGWHSGTRKESDAPRRLIHLTYTRRDLPQQLVQLDYLTRELYDRMSPEHRYLLEIEPPKDGDGVLRHPKREQRGWWN
ncbi:MAG: phytanoyl-CoA dioxygenase family protein [Bauldia sp.]|nr:phytanoyl-CoA dioxygenase family protein [Bauldia sp.]